MNEVLEKRVCKICGKLKSLKSFPSKVHKPTGKRYFQYRCNTCEYVVWKVKNKDKYQGYLKSQRDREVSTIGGRALLLRNRCKQRAKRYGHEFNLSKDLIIEKLNKGFCERTGIKLFFGEFTKHPYAPSVDRIDSSKGYTDDNIQIVCLIYNLCKSEYDDVIVTSFIKDSNV